MYSCQFQANDSRNFWFFILTILFLILTMLLLQKHDYLSVHVCSLKACTYVLKNLIRNWKYKYVLWRRAYMFLETCSHVLCICVRISAHVYRSIRNFKYICSVHICSFVLNIISAHVYWSIRFMFFPLFRILYFSCISIDIEYCI